MAQFEVLIEEVVSVEDHPNADRLSLVGVRGYRCVSAKLGDGSHRYKVGDRVVYVPEGAVVPEWLLRKGFWSEKDSKGMLAGSKGNRVKAIKLRDILSQGILYSVDRFEGYDPIEHFCLTEVHDWVHNIDPERLDVDWGYHLTHYDVGDDVAALLGITKYEPEIPQSMDGDACAIGIENVFRFDIENVKKFPQTLAGREVVVEEKLHGTCMIVGYNPELVNDDLASYFVSSKGLFAKGIVLADTEQNRQSNLYVKAFHRFNLKEKLSTLSRHYADSAVYVLGEVYGPGVQDLKYSLGEIDFRVFGVKVQAWSGGSYWLDVDEKYSVLGMLDLKHPPVLYRGPYDLAKIEELTGGLSTIDGVTIREGVVVTPTFEFEDRWLGRGIVKSVSEQYLLRKGGTEFN